MPDAFAAKSIFSRFGSFMDVVTVLFHHCAKDKEQKKAKKNDIFFPEKRDFIKFNIFLTP